ncbi:MAG TPA: DUF4215 domain-containing protein [Candidatus Binatia bacterium]|nr:DUF4215 domain-containing protein [Candidatus Binatia bacterium]
MRLALVALLVAVSLASARAQVTCAPSVTLAGTSADDELVGTDDPDRIVGNGGRDTLSGLGGSDCLFGGSFEDHIFGGEENDQLVGEGGPDLLDGGPGDDEINGGSDDDTIIGGPGADTIAGEGGDDTFIVHAGDVPAGRTEIVNGGSNNDVAVFDFDPGNVTPPNFVVTDPETGGHYEFVDVERIEHRRCGNGVVDPGEACDDGDRQNGDGCDVNCTPTGCGNGIRTGDEECDDGNATSGDGCSSECERECDGDCPTPVCGDGVLAPGEECDDGNTTAGDGCSALCRRECTTIEECDDGDPCTIDGCIAGACVNPPIEPFANAICRAGQLVQLAECRGDRLRATVALPQRVRKVRGLLRKASQSGKRTGMLLAAERTLSRVQTKSARKAGHGKISAGCAATLDRRLVEVMGLIAGLHR